MVGLSSHNVSHTHHYEQMEHCEYVHVSCFFYVALSSEEIAINTKSTCTFSQNTVICSEIKRKIQRGALVTLNDWYGLAIGTQQHKITFSLESFLYKVLCVVLLSKEALKQVHFREDNTIPSETTEKSQREDF